MYSGTQSSSSLSLPLLNRNELIFPRPKPILFSIPTKRQQKEIVLAIDRNAEETQNEMRFTFFVLAIDRNAEETQTEMRQEFESIYLRFHS